MSATSGPGSAAAPDGRPAGKRAGKQGVRRPSIPGRKALAGGVAMVAFGSFLPWIDTAIGQVSGARGAGLWTFYAAMLGLAAVLVPVRTLALVQGAVFAVVAMAIPVWQVVHLVDLVGLAGWRPGPGLVIVFGGGVVAALAVRTMSAAAWPARR